MSQLLNDMVAQPILVVLALGAVAYLLSRVAAAAGRIVVVIAAGWIIANGVRIAGCVPKAFDPLFKLNLGPVVLNIEFSATYLGSLLAIGAAAFTILIALYSFRYMAGEYWEGKYYAYLTWALAGACLVGWAGNFFVLLVGWELVTLMLFLMLNQGRDGAEVGAAKTYAVLGFADACLLLAVALMFKLPVEPGQPLYNLLLPVSAPALTVGDFGWMGYTIYALLLVAALAKAGAIPLHTWIPAAGPRAPTPVMAYLPAAVDKLMGIYLLARVALDVFRPDAVMQSILMVIGAVTIIAAVFMAMMQHNLKRLLSFHAVSQVGYMVLGIATGTAVGVIGGLFHMVNNAIYKSNLFLMSGTVGRAAGSDDVEDMGGLARQLPITFVCGAVAAAAISGVPPFNGFASKWMIYQGALELRSGLGTAVLVAAVFGSALTLASFVKVIYSGFLGRRPTRGPDPAAARENFWMAAPMVVLAGACIVLGVRPQWVTETILAPAVPGAAWAVSSAGGLWQPGVALGLILIGFAGGFVLLAIFSSKKVKVVRPFLGGEIARGGDDRWRMPGTGFYETIQRLPVLGALLDHGEQGAMDAYHWLGRHGESLVRLLRAQHTGLISLYVAWCAIGLAVTLVYLLIAGHGMP